MKRETGMKKVNYLAISLSMFLALPTVAQSPEEHGLAIAMEADTRDTGWVDRSSDIYMTLRNAQGVEKKRQIRNMVLEVNGDGDKSLTIFEEPRDVKGATFLSFTHATQADDQWIFLPALNRVKRISSGNKSGPFMGSEFAYEDLSSPELEKYSYKYLRDETVDGNDCYVTERTPRYEHSGYSRLVEWTDKKLYQPRKIEYYDKKNALLKTLTFTDYKQHMDKFWRAQSMTMVSHQTNKSTLLEWKNDQFNVGLDDKNFNENALNRLR